MLFPELFLIRLVLALDPTLWWLVGPILVVLAILVLGGWRDTARSARRVRAHRVATAYYPPRDGDLR
jgi:hypothetical protein